MNDKTQNDRTFRLICFVLSAITLSAYLPALRHDFIAYDDQQYVYENPIVSAGLTWKGFLWSFGYHAGNWHPLTWLSHMVDCQFYGLNAGGHHFTNALLHTANTLLLFLALNGLTGKIWRSACVAALFGWHPLHVESVAWVAERKDLLCAFFWMLTLWAYAGYASEIKGRGQKTKVWYTGALFAFALAIMSKPMAVTLPFVLLLLDFWPLNRFADGDWKSMIRRLLWEKIPFFGLSVALCILTLSAQEQAIVSTVGLTITQRCWHALAAYFHYLSAMFVPAGLSVYYPYIVAIPPAQIFIAGLLLATVTIVAFNTIKTRSYIAMGWFWFLGTLIPVIGLVQVGDQAWADRYTYLPLIGLFLTIVWLTADVCANRRRLLYVATMIIGLVLLAETTQQLRHWRNTRTLFTHASEVVPNNYMAITMLGSLLAREGNLDEAMKHYRAALEIKPGFPEAHFFLGNALDQRGDLDQAIAEYRRALWFKPIMETTHILLGIALGKKQQPEEAARHFLEAIKINPDSAVAHNNLARICHTAGSLDDAIAHYTLALKLDPKLAQAHNNLGVILLQKGQLTAGTAALRESLRLNPTNSESQLNLALALNQQQAWVEAAELFKSVGPKFPDANAHCQFGLALARLGKTREAMGQYASALLIQADFPEALDRLAWILATDSNDELRNSSEAIQMAERACELTQRKDPVKLATLAAAYAEGGRYPEANSTIRTAQELALRLDRKELANQYRLMLEQFSAIRPWRANPRN